MGRPSRKSQRHNVRESVAGARDDGSRSRGRSLGVRIGAALGVAGLLLAGLVVGAVVFAATALRLRSASDPRLAEFIHHSAGGGQGGEPGGPCTAGVGIPVA